MFRRDLQPLLRFHDLYIRTRIRGSVLQIRVWILLFSSVLVALKMPKIICVYKNKLLTVPGTLSYRTFISVFNSRITSYLEVTVGVLWNLSFFLIFCLLDLEPGSDPGSPKIYGLRIQNSATNDEFFFTLNGAILSRSWIRIRI
jgi:hypothetical protein